MHCAEEVRFKPQKGNKIKIFAGQSIFIGPRSPSTIYVSGSLFREVTDLRFVNLTDVTLTDEDTKKAIQGNVAMQVTQPGDQVCN